MLVHIFYHRNSLLKADNDRLNQAVTDQNNRRDLSTGLPTLVDTMGDKECTNSGKKAVAVVDEKLPYLTGVVDVDEDYLHPDVSDPKHITVDPRYVYMPGMTSSTQEEAQYTVIDEEDDTYEQLTCSDNVTMSDRERNEYQQLSKNQC